jgi:hypothetical protein
MNRPLFPQEALDRLASPDRLDQLMPLTSPHGWIALAGAGLLLLLSVLWAVFGSIAVTVRGDGCLSRGGVPSVVAPASGIVTRVSVEAGTPVKKGQLLARLGTRDVTSPVDGRVLSVRVKQGDAVEAGTLLFKLEDLAQALRAILYVPARQGAEVRRGQFVSVTAAGQHLPGRVRSVERFPSSRASLMRTLESEEWVDQVLRNGPVLEVVVEFGDDLPGDEELYSGTPCQGQITVEQRAPIHFVLGRR